MYVINFMKGTWWTLSPHKVHKTNPWTRIRPPLDFGYQRANPKISKTR